MDTIKLKDLAQITGIDYVDATEVYDCGTCGEPIHGEVLDLNDEPICQDCMDDVISDAEYRAEAYIEDQAIEAAELAGAL